MNHQLSSRWVASLVGAASIVAGLHNAEARMVTPGQFSVGPGGSATYSIPVQIPPGTAGVEPKISLNYDSQGGNGLAGVGWSVGGLSAITRCPSTKAQDGTIRSVTYSDQDQFCLDGQRLMLVGGTHGSEGAEYRTERDSFSKVVVHAGPTGTGPTSFDVWTKAGQLMKYGATADSRIKPTGSAANLVWALNRVEDSVGNYFDVSYSRDDVNGAFYPMRIDYTGNSKKATGTYSSVRFNYQTRTDYPSHWHAGVVSRYTWRLSSVETYVGESQKKRYLLQYMTSPQTSRSILQSVQECSSATCLPKIEFDSDGIDGNLVVGKYQDLAWSLSAPTKTAYQVVKGDFNGDGKTDFGFVGEYKSKLYLALSKGDGTFNTTIQQLSDWWFGTPPQAKYDLITGDFNGDGKTDFAFIGGEGSNSALRVAMSNGDGTFNYLNPQTLGWGFGSPPSASYQLIVGDFNRDGRTDFAYVGGGSTSYLHLALSNGNGTFSEQPMQALSTWGFGTPPSTSWDLVTGDFDGDGSLDFGFVGGPAGVSSKLNLALNNGNGVFRFSVVDLGWPFGDPAHSAYQLAIGDFNGDGKTDFAYVGNTPSKVHLATSRGDGTFDTTEYQAGWQFGTPPGAGYDLVTGDFNGDGMTDIAFVGGGPSQLYVYLSKGDSTFVPHYESLGWSFGMPPSAGYQLIEGDINGDGKSDFVYVGEITSKAYSLLSKSNYDAVTRIKNGIGAETAVSYDFLTTPSVYAKDTNAVFPTIDLQIPLQVVASMSVSNGIGGSTTTSYTYGGLKADLNGRGMMGFRWMSAAEIETKMRTKTEYRQDWPYTGMPSALDQWVSLGMNGTQEITAPLKSVRNTFGCRDYGSPTGCTIVPGYRYFPYVNNSVETSNDLNGTPLPAVTTATAYDDYGNPTSIVISTSGGYSKTTTNVYDNITSGNWFLGRLRNTTVTSTIP